MDSERGRWFSFQPNVTGRGVLASYDRRFWTLLVLLGVGTGLAAGLLMRLLRIVQRLAWDEHGGGYLHGIRAAPAWRHLVVLAVAAGIVALAVFALGRLRSAGSQEVSDAVWLGGGQLAPVPSLLRGIVSIVTVAMGVSLGREGAPQLAGAAWASRLSDWAKVPAWQRRLLVASGAGAGFGAVYNVPLGGTLFALEVLLGTLALPLVIPALVPALVATAVAWIFLGHHPEYHIPTYLVHPSQVVWGLVFGPVAGFAAVAWVRLIAWVSSIRPTRWGRYVAPLAVFLVLGAVAIPYPQLLGNGSDVVQLAAVGQISLGLFAVLLALKPVATLACLGTGTPGGLFTPTLTVGVLLAGLTGTVFSHIWPGAPLGSYALIGGGAFLAAAMQGPLSATVIVLELTHHMDSLMVPTLTTVVLATVIARRFGAPSIYSARIHEPADGAPGAGPFEIPADVRGPESVRPG